MVNNINYGPLCKAVALVCMLGSTRFLHGIQVTAHRGASYDAPENTLAAFSLAWEKGADGIEGDFYLSADGHVVCIHDSTTERTGDINLTVASSTLAELRSVDVGSWKGQEWAGERIPTLEEIIAAIPPGKYIQIEIKVGVEIVEPIAQILEASSLANNQIMIICFNQAVVTAIKQRLPDCCVLWLTSIKDTGPTASEVLSVLEQTGADGLGASANATIIDSEYVEAVKNGGTHLFHVWTVNDRALAAQFTAAGLDAISTDRPDYIRPYVRKTPLAGPVIHWNFDSVPYNSGSGGARYNAVLHGAPAYDSGRVGSAALRLDGLDDYVSVAYKLPEEGAIALWYYARPWYNYQSVIDNSVDANDWEMWIYDDGRLRFRVGAGVGEVTYDLDNLSGSNHWYHIVVVWDKAGAETRLYVDGVQRSMAAIGEGWIVPGSTFYLGGGNAGNTRGNGSIDDFRIYNHILTHLDVQNIHNEFKNKMIHLPLDGNAIDYAGGDQSASLSGAPVYVEGVYGQALKCDGNYDNAAINYTLTENGTIALWYFAKGPWYNYQTVFDNSVNADDWEMWIYNDGRLRFRIDAGIGEVTYDLDNLDGSDHWYHIAVAWQRYGSARLYVNGVERSNDPVGGGWIDPGDFIYIGGGNPGNVRGNGIWDEFCVYDRALAAADIFQLALKPLHAGTVVFVQ